MYLPDLFFYKIVKYKTKKRNRKRPIHHMKRQQIKKKLENQSSKIKVHSKLKCWINIYKPRKLTQNKTIIWSSNYARPITTTNLSSPVMHTPSIIYMRILDQSKWQAVNHHLGVCSLYKHVTSELRHRYILAAN